MRGWLGQRLTCGGAAAVFREEDDETAAGQSHIDRVLPSYLRNAVGGAAFY